METRRKLTKKRVALFVFLSLIAVWLLGDLIYGRIIVHRMRRWEQTVEFDDDGVRVGCREYTIGEGPSALLLIHGFNDSPACYYRMAPYLANRGFKCRVMRLPGFGESTAAYARVDHQKWLDAVDREVKALRAEHDQVSIVAHSLGGAITIRYLLDRPHAAGRVVLLAPAVAVNNERSPVLSARAWHQIADRVLLFTNLVENVYEIDAHSPEARAYPHQYRFVPRRATTEFFRVIESISGSGSRFKTPLMMVLSRDDKVVDWKAAERFYDQAPCPKRLKFVTDAGHVIPFDNGWQTLCDEIVAFAGPVD